MDSLFAAAQYCEMAEISETLTRFSQNARVDAPNQAASSPLPPPPVNYPSQQQFHPSSQLSLLPSSSFSSLLSYPLPPIQPLPPYSSPVPYPQISSQVSQLFPTSTPENQRKRDIHSIKQNKNLNTFRELKSKQNEKGSVNKRAKVEKEAVLAEKIFRKKLLINPIQIINTNTCKVHYAGRNKGWSPEEHLYLLKKIRVSGNCRDWEKITTQINEHFNTKRSSKNCYSMYKIWNEILPDSFCLGGEVKVQIYANKFKVLTRETPDIEWKIFKECKYKIRNLGMLPIQSQTKTLKNLPQSFQDKEVSGKSKSLLEWSNLRDMEESEDPEAFFLLTPFAKKEIPSISENIEKSEEPTFPPQSSTVRKKVESTLAASSTHSDNSLSETFDHCFPKSVSSRTSFSLLKNINIFKVVGNPLKGSWQPEEIIYLLSQIRETEGEVLDWEQITINLNKRFNSQRSSKSCYNQYNQRWKGILPGSFYLGGEVHVKISVNEIKVFVPDERGSLNLYAKIKSVLRKKPKKVERF